MKIEEQVFTIEQTEKLIEFGFDTSNASCYYPTDASNNPYYFPAFNCGNDKRTYPAFTVCDIIGLMPMLICHEGAYYSFAMDNVKGLGEVPHIRNFGFEQKLSAAFWQTAVMRMCRFV